MTREESLKQALIFKSEQLLDAEALLQYTQETLREAREEHREQRDGEGCLCPFCQYTLHALGPR